MVVQIEAYTPARFKEVRQYCDALWGPRDETFYCWRFNACPNVSTWIVMVDGMCGALISAMHKRYRVDGETVECLEIFDWSSLPRFRGKGLGIMVVKRVMDSGFPVFTLGGTVDTLKLLPRLKWITVTDARVFALPLRGAFVERKLHDRNRVAAVVAGAAFSAAGGVWFRARRRRSGVAHFVVPTTSLDPRFSDLYDALHDGKAAHGHHGHHRLIATLDRPILDWAAHGLSRPGQFLCHAILDGNALRAWGVSRVVVTSTMTTAEIVDAYAAPPDVDVYSSLIGEMTACLSGYGVDAVVTTASCARMQEALRRNRFIAGRAHPLLCFWPPGRPFPEGPVHIMRGSADHLLMPHVPSLAPPEITAVA